MNEREHTIHTSSYTPQTCHSIYKPHFISYTWIVSTHVYFISIHICISMHIYYHPHLYVLTYITQTTKYEKTSKHLGYNEGLVNPSRRILKPKPNQETKQNNKSPTGAWFEVTFSVTFLRTVLGWVRAKVRLP